MMPKNRVNAALTFGRTKGAGTVPFRAQGRTARAILVVPDGPEGDDQCLSIVTGSPLHHDPGLSYRGPLWRVLMMVNDCAQGLPIRVHPDCERRAGL